MQAVYALIAVFLFLCVFFARWYLCSVRELCETAAILEILMMILSSFIIGFAGSWLLSENIFRSVRTHLGGLLKEKNVLTSQLKLLEKENQVARMHHQEGSLLTEGRKSTEPLLREVSNLKQELDQYQARYENLKKESDVMRLATAELKNQLIEEKAQAERAKMAVLTEASIDKKGTPEIDAPEIDAFPSRFTPSTWEKKDDLTLISGIGPVIQRKLNSLGICTFKQLSQLTPEMVHQVATSIKFFPDRIGRDNWIGQAAALALVKHKK